jgi:NADH dehydrogenase FAD-containing subunit
MPENRPSLSPLAFDVVIVGGGFAGVFCARALEQKLGPEAKRRVAIVAEENFMVFQPMLPEIAGSALAPRHVVNPIRRLCSGPTVLRAKVRDIDLPGRKVLLDAMVESGVKRLVFSSTCATFGIPDRVPIDETLPQRPINPYGESKLMFEKVLRWYDEIHGIR